MGTMKTAIACALALGMAGAAAGVRADGDCCRGAAGKAACCSTGTTTEAICLDANKISAAELAKRLSQAIGAEVRVQGPAYGEVNVKLCAKTPEAAVAQAAKAMNARWRLAFVFGQAIAPGKAVSTERALSVSFRKAGAATAAYVAAAQAGGIIIADKPLAGKVTFQGKNVPAGMVMDAIASAAGVHWKTAYVLQIGPEVLAERVAKSAADGGKSVLKARPDSPLTHLHRSPGGPEGVAPAPGMIVKDPAGDLARLEAEAMRRQLLGEWAGVFTQDTPKDVRRAVRDLRIRVETAIQKLESYPEQNRHLGVDMWHARYERMQEDYKNLTPEQQKQVQPVLDAMKYFGAKPVN